jgi:lactoylglutathione lyase
MKIEHIAIWCKNLEAMKTFYCTLFGATANEKYKNPITGFSSYFITFPSGGARLELMQKPDIAPNLNALDPQSFGLIHYAIQVGSEAAVWQMVEELKAQNCLILRGPRTTGDGYFEVETVDIEGNRLEIMA